MECKYYTFETEIEWSLDDDMYCFDYGTYTRKIYIPARSIEEAKELAEIWKQEYNERNTGNYSESILSMIYNDTASEEEIQHSYPCI